MALEDLTGTKYIDSLVVTNPDGTTDPKSEGDDHLRGIKNVIKNTWANITGAVTASHGDLSATENFEETISATTLEVTLATGKTINITDVSALKIAGTAVDSTAAELNKLNGSTASAVEFNTLSGVTSSVQDQIDTKADNSTGVTNGDSHDHSGGDGGLVPETGLASAVTAQLVTNGDTHNHDGGDGGLIPVTGLAANVENGTWVVVSDQTLSSQNVVYFDDQHTGLDLSLYSELELVLHGVVVNNSTDDLHLHVSYGADPHTVLNSGYSGLTGTTNHWEIASNNNLTQEAAHGRARFFNHNRSGSYRHVLVDVMSGTTFVSGHGLNTNTSPTTGIHVDCLTSQTGRYILYGRLL